MKRKIGFLTRRKYTGLKSLHRYILSYIIHRLTGKLVHCYLVYKDNDNNEMYVREMEYDGDRHTLYSEYRKKYSERIFAEIDLEENVNKYNYDYVCKNAHVKYDYSSLFIKFPLLYFFNKILCFFTINKRTCSEDCARIINIMYPFKIKNVEYITPTKLFNLMRNENENEK